MNTPQTVRSYEYKNDFLFIVIREAPEFGPRAHVYCCGINIARFDPICWGKAGICSNPAFKGLQMMRADVSAFALKRGIETKNAAHVDCGSITPQKGTGWFREDPLLIERASPRVIMDILEFGVMDLVKSILLVCAPDAKLPAKLPNPPELQKYFESISVANYKEMAPPKIARARDRR